MVKTEQLEDARHSVTLPSARQAGVKPNLLAAPSRCRARLCWRIGQTPYVLDQRFGKVYNGRIARLLPTGAFGRLVADELARDRSPRMHAQLHEHTLRMTPRSMDRDPQQSGYLGVRVPLGQ